VSGHLPVKEDANNAVQNRIHKMIPGWVQLAEEIVEAESQYTKWTIWLVTLFLLIIEEHNKLMVVYIEHSLYNKLLYFICISFASLPDISIWEQKNLEFMAFS